MQSTSGSAALNIILSTPNDATSAAFLANLKSTLETGLVRVVIVRQAKLDLQQYKKLIKAIVPIAQTHDCAVLLDNHPQLVRELDADGTQITTGHKDVISTVASLKPDFIVGAVNITTRHEAMLCGEAGVDYLSFGDFEQTPDEATLALAQWWTKLFEIPCAVFDAITPLKLLKPSTAEFIGLGNNIWQADAKPSEAIRNLPRKFKTQQWINYFQSL